ncbi:MAG: YqeG family HAD IIIA-type phosphatase [Oscillospiraceae bacterium]|nr:YqeG family HAD IIIA-type phosphatase [Oscillospiraceae bacterium]
MSLFTPDYFFDKIWDIPLSFLQENNVKCLLLDVDNTLTTHDNPEVHQNAAGWLDLVSNAGIKSVIISNNTEPRVAPFANGLGVEFVSNAQKPLSKGSKQAVKLTKISKDNMLVIGDQIFTDVLFGKLSGVKTVLVTPMELEKTKFFKFKRWLERLILKEKRK